MINKFNGVYKTDHPISIAPQETDIDYILNECKNWAYDENTHEFTLFKQSPSGVKKSNIKVCLDDYTFETDTFYIALIERIARTPVPLFELSITPIHPDANVRTTCRVFIATYEEMEKLSHDPSAIPYTIMEEFKYTEPFDISITTVLHEIETRSNGFGYANPLVPPAYTQDMVL